MTRAQRPKTSWIADTPSPTSSSPPAWHVGYSRRTRLQHSAVSAYTQFIAVAQKGRVSSNESGTYSVVSANHKHYRSHHVEVVIKPFPSTNLCIPIDYRHRYHVFLHLLSTLHSTTIRKNKFREPVKLLGCLKASRVDFDKISSLAGKALSRSLAS